MHILYISSKKRWGGVTSWMLKTALGLCEKGHTVWILSHPDSKFNSKVKNYKNLVERKLGLEYNPLSIIFIKRFIKKYKIDLIVSNIEKEVGIAGIAARWAGIPHIRRVGSALDYKPSFKMKWNHKKLVDACLVPCNSLTEQVVKRVDFLSPQQFTTIYNGRDPQAFNLKEVATLRAKWGATPDTLIIGSTGQLLPIKRLDMLIEAFAMLLKKYSNMLLILAGEGREKGNLEALVRTLGIEENVKFIGFTEQPALTAAAYDFAVLSSSFEGFPNAVVEYFSVGKAVVATAVGGVEEIVKHNKNGLVTASGDIHMLVQNLEKLILDKSLRISLGEKALKDLESGFSEQKMIDDLELYFSKMVKAG